MAESPAPQKFTALQFEQAADVMQRFSESPTMQGQLGSISVLLRHAAVTERAREELHRLLQKATLQADRVMQSWYDDEYEALAKLGIKFEHELEAGRHG